ncbi:MAG: ABC transporter ATP-binding protein [Rhodospirillales bacterium]|nr:ABC transporter ATP-binding protein [Rhodospirillales bacterium]
MSYEIRLHDLSKIYPDGTVALGGVSFICPRSACTTLVGPSGSGKTTILKIISGLLDASGGTVSFDDRVMTHLPPEKRNIGMVFQSYALFPNMTVLENVEFGLLVRKVSAADRRRRALEALESVQIAPLAQRRIRQLSGGQQQRVALARAIVFQPDILLLDEPLSALDAKIRQELRGELAASLRQFKITAVYVTHDQEEAMALGDQVVVMDHGKIMQIGTPFEVYARPANEFVARFIGTANLYDVEIQRSANAHFHIRLGFSEVSVAEDTFRQRWPGVAGGSAQLMCRPQDVSIAELSNAHARIRISSLLFLGDRIRITGETENGKTMRFEAHNTTKISVGDVVPIRLDLDCIHIIPVAD